ncbi:MAG: hypothetical protein QM775_21680 [Pirellulales bacterium]
MIIGFPGETDAEFEETLQVCDALGFSKIHIFPFSPRKGTPAATMADQVPAPVKQRRVEMLERLADSLRDRYHAALRGRKLQLLVEGRLPDRPDVVAGTACRYTLMELDSSTAGGTLPARNELVEVTAGPSQNGRIIAI